VKREYWGAFEGLRCDESVRVEEVVPSHSTAATIWDGLTAEYWDDSECLRLAALSTGPVLELGCGTGGLLLKLAAMGQDVIGLDPCEETISLLRSKVKAVAPDIRERITLKHEPTATYRFNRRFDLILLPHFAMGSIWPVGPADVLRNAAEHLSDTGRLVLDYLTVLDEKAIALAGHSFDREFALCGRRLWTTLGVKYCAEQRALVANVCWSDSERSGGFGRTIMSVAVRAFEPAEVDSLLDEAGLVVSRRRISDVGDRAVRGTLITCRRPSPNRHPLWHPYHGPTDLPWAGITLTEGSGCEVSDAQGNRYLDASGGLWSVNCGLGLPEIVDAVTKQLRRLSYGTLFLGRSNVPALALAQRLIALTEGRLESVFLTGSGSESVELAMKLARTFFALGGRPNKKGILYLDASYHGTFFGSIGVSGLVPEQRIFAPLLPGLCAVPAPLPQTCPPEISFAEHADRCADAFERMLAEGENSVAAFIAEPVLGSAGVVIPPRSYFERIQRACQNHSVLLIIDEVATGFGRTGRWFASEHYGLRPDVMLLGKGINSGYLPLGAVLFSAEIGERLADARTGIIHGSSHNGNPACCAAALATLDVLERDGLVDRSRDLGAYFLERLHAQAGTPGLGPLRGLGLMIFAGLCDENGSVANLTQVLAICESMQRRGVLVYPTEGGIMFYPPFVIQREQIDAVVSCLVGVLRDHRLADGAVTAKRGTSSLNPV
jgi:adenosylmethionine-8-amino-7-oxononanoate aminotransferase/SAM-dependent methyltransferase